MTTTFRDLFRYRQLIAVLTARDLKARYRGSVLGFFWSLANPLLLLGVYTLVFTRFFPRPGVDAYPLFLFAGILPWTFFAGSVLESTSAISSNAGLVKKVMFPAEALPLVVVASHLVHFALALPILLLALGVTVAVGKAVISPVILLAPVYMLVQTVFVAGIALMISSAAVLFRDLRDLVANLVQLGFFLTPVLYPLHSDFIPAWGRVLLRLNPMTPFVVSYQSLFVFGKVPDTLDVLLMLLYATISIMLGFWVFDRLRDTLAEVI
ncbi:MAG TPA: ABC transporter permease [Thermoanaerobaculia bacterium]|nr:ABC transporter permease [Thermoanaerobaculia bacterium]